VRRNLKKQIEQRSNQVGQSAAGPSGSNIGGGGGSRPGTSGSSSGVGRHEEVTRGIADGPSSPGGGGDGGDPSPSNEGKKGKRRSFHGAMKAVGKAMIPKSGKKS